MKDIISIFHFHKFDAITRFKLENNFVIAVIMGLLIPTLTQLKGLYLSVSVISLFFIFEKIALKTNDYFDKKFTLPEMYKIGIIINIIYISTIWLYWYNKLILTYILSFLTVCEIAVFTIFNIKFNTYLAEKDSRMFNMYQKLRNNTWADGILLGALTSTIISFYGDKEFIIIIIWILFGVYISRLFVNFSIYDKLSGY